MGRMMSPDPSGLYFANPKNPQSLNLYSYGLNNPLTNIDPTGLTCQTNSSDGTVYDDLDGKGCDVVDKADAAQAPSATVNADGHYDLSTEATNAGTNQSITGWLQHQHAPLPPRDVPLNANARSIITKVAKQTGSLPDICSGGAFGYAGVEGEKGSTSGFVGPMVVSDSRETLPKFCDLGLIA
jgi:uncharacterized protein RhaS with RHS repeats